MFPMDLRVGDAVEVVPCGNVGVQRRRVLVPVGMFEGLVGSRGAIHRVKIGGCLFLSPSNEVVVLSVPEFNVSCKIELTQTGLTGFVVYTAGQNARNCPIPED